MMLLDYFRVFGWISRKKTKSANLGNFGVLCYGVGILCSSVSPHQGAACPRHGAAVREA